MRFRFKLEGRVSGGRKSPGVCTIRCCRVSKARSSKLHAVSYRLPDRPETFEALEAAIEQALAAFTVGWDAVQGLRSSTVMANDPAPQYHIWQRTRCPSR